MSQQLSCDQPVVGFGDGLWTVEGPLVKDMGLWFPTRMIIDGQPDGLWVCDPVPVGDDTRRQIEQLGQIKVLVASTQRHVWRLAGWHDWYPDAQLWTCGHVPAKLKRLPLTGVIGDQPIWDGIDQVVFQGNKLLAEAELFHQPSKTLIMGDLVQNNSPLPGHRLGNLVFKLAGGASPGGVGRDLKMTFTDKPAARRSLDTIMSWDFDKVIIAHGPIIASDAKQYIAQAFTWLTSR